MARRTNKKRPPQPVLPTSQPLGEQGTLNVQITLRESWGKFLLKYVPPLLTALGVWFGGFLAYNELILKVQEKEKQHQENFSNLKRQLDNSDLAVRIDAVERLVEDYAKEAIPELIECLGDRNTAFTNAVKDRLGQIGEDAVTPLVEKLRQIQREITALLNRRLSLDVVLNKPLEDVRNELKAIPETKEEEIESIITKLVSRQNAVEVLACLLRIHHISGLQFSMLDLSGASLVGIYLLYANLTSSNLSSAELMHAHLLYADLSSANLISTNLSSADLSFSKIRGAILTSTNLSSALLVWADLSGAKLKGANLSNASLNISNLADADLEGAILQGVHGFRDVNNFSNTNLKGVKGLFKEDLEYAKSKGAIID